MSLRLIPDWEKIQTRFHAWWQGDVADRCMIAATAPQPNAPPAPELPADARERWTSIEFLGKLTEHKHRSTYFAGDAFPTWPDTGIQLTASAMLDEQVKLDPHTLWKVPILTGDTIEYQGVKWQENNSWRQFGLELTRRAVQEAKDTCIPLVGGYFATGDTLSELRDPNTLLLELLDRPDEVQAAELYLLEICNRNYKDFCAIADELGQGYSSWLRVWAPKNFSIVQNDIAYMISPEMYNRIYLPVLEKQLADLDYVLYHVDGVGNFNHVPTLCELPRLQAMQIQPWGVSPLHYLDTLRLVQQAGKSLHLSLEPQEVQEALRLLSPRGLYIETYCKSPAEADELVRNVAKWSAKAPK